MASVRKVNATGKWIVDYKDHTDRRARKVFEKKKEADAFLGRRLHVEVRS